MLKSKRAASEPVLAQEPLSANAERTGKRSESTSPVSRRRKLVGLGLLVVLVMVLALQVLGTWDFWTAVWQRGTLIPGEWPSDSLMELAGFQPRRGPAFDLSKLTVPAREIRAGGPPKDGIPALTNPRMISANEATYLRPDDRVIGIAVGEDVRAYPLRILNYHEIVNDRAGELPVAVTYCPLCDSAAAFDRRTPLGERDFGVSGLLYNSNVLMYDRRGRPESLWSQLKTEGVSGPAAEKSLTPLPLELTTWNDWQSRYPATKVLSPQTGHARDYSRSPYAGYFDRPQLMFTVTPTSDRLPTKERILGVWTTSASRAYPESAFGPERTRIEDLLDGKRVVIGFNPQARSLRVVATDEGVDWMYSLWFAWYAFRPETSVFDPEER